ncbi:hypothetical protein N8772_02755 [Rickettsiales bacterium]|nr:hypothetical protein [Rickettsiales bacterium]
MFSSQVPGFVSVSRDNENLIVTVKENECYKSSQTTIPYKTNPFIFANILGGLYGLTSTTTDRVSGAAWTYDETVYVNTRKKRSCKTR